MRRRLTARGESPAAFDRRCILGLAALDRFLQGSNTTGILSRRALPDGRITALGATRAFPHGLLALGTAVAAMLVMPMIYGDVVRGQQAAALPTEAGAHRFVWDLRLPGPWAARAAQSGRRGPRVPPGRYEARLTRGDWSETRAFQVRLDPRVAAEGLTSSDIRAQVDLAMEARDALSEARLAVERMEQARVDGALGALREIYDELVTGSTRYSQPRVVDQLQYLYSNLIVAAQRPGRDAELRYEDLRGVLDEQMAALEQLLETSR